jgi:hypothetical protein
MTPRAIVTDELTAHIKHCDNIEQALDLAKERLDNGASSHIYIQQILVIHDISKIAQLDKSI